MVAPGGRAQGTVPGALIPCATSDGLTEVTIDGQAWLVERTPLHANGQTEAIAQLVLVRQADAGLCGLFPYARATLVTLALAAISIALASFWLACRRST